MVNKRRFLGKIVERVFRKLQDYQWKNEGCSYFILDRVWCSVHRKSLRDPAVQHADDASTVPSKVLVQTKKENIVGDQGGKDTRRTKYAVGAVGGAVGDGIVAAVVGSVQ